MSSVSLPAVAILAGGRATRLQLIGDTLPKALIPIAGRPFILHQFDLLRQSGIQQVVLCVGYHGALIEQTLGDGHQYDLRLAYSYDGDTPLGTGGALIQALPLLGEEFFVLYGDTYLDCDYVAIYQAFRASGKSGLMTVFANQGWLDTNNVVFENGEIVLYNKHQLDPRMHHIDYGLGLLKASALASFTQPADLADIYAELVKLQQLAGHEVFQRFYEIGTPGALEETDRYLQAKAG